MTASDNEHNESDIEQDDIQEITQGIFDDENVGAANDDHEEEEEEYDQPRDDYHKVFGEEMAGPKGTMAKRFNQATPHELRALTKSLFDFLSDPLPNLNLFNTDTDLYTALVALPESDQMRLVYGFGLGTSRIGRKSTLDGNILVLTKEADATLGPSLPMLLPMNTIKFIERPCPSGARVQQKLMEEAGSFPYPAWKPSSLHKNNEKEKCMKIAPVPAYLFLDAFEHDIPASEAYERLVHCNMVKDEYIQHALAVTRASLLPTSKKGTHLPITCLINSGDSRELRQWATMKCRNLLPLTNTAQPPPLIPVPPMPPQPAQAAPVRPALREEAPQITMRTPAKDKISRREQIRLFTMVGYDDKAIANLTEEDLLAHIRVVEEEPTKHMKEIVIKERIATHEKYTDCPVPIHPMILEALRKRDFGAADGFARPSYAQACTKLSPFLCIDFTETQMATIQEVNDAFHHASVTTPADYIAMKSTKAIVPDDHGDFITMLCTFANLIYAWFTGGSTLFRQVEALIKAIKAFQRSSRSYFTIEVKATILWLTFLQARIFAEGKGEIFSPFTRMVDNLVAKDTRIQYAEVPADLIINSQKAAGKHRTTTSGGTGKRKIDDAEWHSSESQEDRSTSMRDRPNNNRADNSNCWHSKLKESLEEPLATLTKKGCTQREVTIKKIADYCGASLNQLNPNRRICGSNRVLGYCFSGKRCQRVHEIPKDADVPKITSLLTKFIEHPEGLLEAKK